MTANIIHPLGDFAQERNLIEEARAAMNLFRELPFYGTPNWEEVQILLEEQDTHMQFPRKNGTIEWADDV